MKQLGVLQGSNILGDEIPQGGPADPYRTKLGLLKKKPLSAIGWYQKQHGLKLNLSVFPIIYFTTEDGEGQGVYIEEIVDDYERRDKRARNA